MKSHKSVQDNNIDSYKYESVKDIANLTDESKDVDKYESLQDTVGHDHKNSQKYCNYYLVQATGDDELKKLVLTKLRKNHEIEGIMGTTHPHMN